MTTSAAAIEGGKLLDYWYYEIKIPAARAIFLFREYVGRRKSRYQDVIIADALKNVRT